MTGLTIEELIERDNQVLRSRQAVPVSSGFTPETLKQAMDDAKEVRAQALRNAKQALEEAFSRKFADMFAQKLNDYGSTNDTENLRR